MQEYEAIARLKQGDIVGLETLVKNHQLRATRAAYLIVRDYDLAEDVVEDAFLRAYERIHQFDADRPFGPWFLRIVINIAKRAAVQHKRHISLDNVNTDHAGCLANASNRNNNGIRSSASATGTHASRSTYWSIHI